MPITYSADAQRQVIFTKWEGTVTASDLGQYLTKLLNDPQALAYLRCVSDLRGCSIQFAGVDMRELVQSIVLPLLNGRRWVSALVVDDPVAFGVSRQYKVYSSEYSRNEIFDNEAVALEWALRQ